jgi:peptide/nickel transport system permease protein
MTRYILRRLLLSVIVLFGLSFIVTGMLHLSGDPVAVMLAGVPARPDEIESLRHELGLDKPFALQYLDFVAGALRGDLGISVRFNQPAVSIVLERVPATTQLTVASMLFAIAVAVPVGIISALRVNSVADYVGRVLTLTGQAIPLFWLGIMLVLVFAVRLRWLPSAGRQEAISIILPAVTLGLYPMARIARTLRASLLEVLSCEYIRTAYAKGLSERRVILVHALQNAALPVITVIGLQVGTLMGGAVITETIFAWPGLGWLMVQAIEWRDFPLIRAEVTVAAVSLILVNLLTDILYVYLNPQIRYT